MEKFNHLRCKCTLVSRSLPVLLSVQGPKPKQTKSAAVVLKSESEEDSDVPLMERLKRNTKQVKYFDEEVKLSGAESDNGSDWNEDQEDSDYN